MESRLRRLLHDPEVILDGAGVEAGQSVLEVGSGTGFLTLPTAWRVGADGRLIAIEPLATYAERLRRRVDAAGLGNVEIMRRDALDSGLPDACVERALLFGVLPFPTLPLPRLLPEMQPRAEARWLARCLDVSRRRLGARRDHPRTLVYVRGKAQRRLHLSATLTPNRRRDLRANGSCSPYL